MKQKWKNKKVGVMYGGISKEREISLKTGKAIIEALKKKGYNVIAIDCQSDLPQTLAKANIDCAFIALHGPYGEDGAVQGLLEWMQIPYTGCGILASAMAMDKAVLNSLSRDLGVLVPNEAVFDDRFDDLSDFIAHLKIPLPVFVKPAREGSSINAGVVKDKDQLKAAIEKALQSDCKVLIEEYIEGKEITIPILNGKALPSIEIVPKNQFYDYQAKYTKGMTEYILPARISKTLQEELNKTSEKLFRAIDGYGFARVDFLVSRMDEKPYFLEINTIPGMTETSLFPKSAKQAGIEFEDLCEEILNGANLKLKAIS